MPRQSRKPSESKIYHVMVRGNERRAIFLDEQDRKRYKKILLQKNEDNKYVVYAYCLMNNHVHLLINEGEETISRIMQRLNISYVRYFNAKYERIGHLFQGRFRSEPVEQDRYLLAVIRYIHLNPVKAGIVKRAEDYKWSSFGEYLSDDNRHDKIVDPKFILEMFHEDTVKAVEAFTKYTKVQDNRQFLDIQEEKMHRSEAQKIIHDILRENHMTLEALINCSDVGLRNKIILEIRDRTKLSLRKMAEVLNMSKSTIGNVIRR